MWERVSYFITAVAAVLGWLITFYVDRISETPTVEYTIQESRGNGTLNAIFILSNVNRTQSYGPVKVTFLAQKGTTIRDVQVHPIEPAEESRNPVTLSPGSANFEVPKLMPGAGIKFDVAVSGQKRPDLRLDSDVAVRFTERSFDTWLARNETGVVVGLIVIWAAVLAGLILFSAFGGRRVGRRRPRGKADAA